MWEQYGVRWEQAPSGLHWTILEMRAYAIAYEQVKLNRKNSKRHPLEVTPMVQRVQEIQMAIGMEKQARSLALVPEGGEDSESKTDADAPPPGLSD